MTRRARSLGSSIVAVVVLLLLVSGCGDRDAAPGTGPNGDYYDLGDFHLEVATSSADAQLWFDRGLIQAYGFNHEEAVRCFEKVIEADPDCAMAHWGIAYALGPNINNTEMEPEAVERAHTQVRRAVELAQDAKERALIEALALRYAHPAPEDRSELDRAYADAMRKVHAAHAGDPDVTALFAESLMVLRPWNHFAPDGTPAPETPEIVATLEAGLRDDPDHVALCHLYIHTMEASPTPEKALPAADRLRDMVPEAGHLVHMPSHIDVLLGRYEAVIEANRKAIDADRKFLEREGAENFYTLYRVHNYHFLVYGAMFDGQKQLALETSRELVRQIPETLLQEWTDYLDAFVPTPYHAMVRFGLWDEILAEPRPADGLPVTLSLWHYARGLAHATRGEVDRARVEQAAFEQARATVPETSILFNNTSRDILSVAAKMLEGEIEYRRGRLDAAFAALREAVRLDDGLSYDEPWGWMQPARHALGALLLEQGRAGVAEAVYREDLRRHPDNVWSLHGLAESLRAQGNEDEARATQSRMDRAATRADVKIKASCYCRLNTSG